MTRFVSRPVTNRERFRKHPVELAISRGVVVSGGLSTTRCDGSASCRFRRRNPTRPFRAKSLQVGEERIHSSVRSRERCDANSPYRAMGQGRWRQPHDTAGRACSMTFPCFRIFAWPVFWRHSIVVGHFGNPPRVSRSSTVRRWDESSEPELLFRAVASLIATG